MTKEQRAIEKEKDGLKTKVNKWMTNDRDVWKKKYTIIWE